MGSWNATCGLSNLPIKNGEKCKLIFLIEKENLSITSGGVCYPTGLRSIYSLPISGTYNDYGCIKDVENNPYNDFFLSSFNEEVKNEIVSFKGRYLSDYQLPLKSIEKVAEIVERGCVFRKDDFLSAERCRPVTQRMTFMLIKDDVYLSALKIVSEKTHINDRVKGKIAKATNYLDSQDKDKRDYETFKEIFVDLFASFGLIYSEGVDVDFNSYELILRSFNNDAICRYLLGALADFRYLCIFMSLTRKLFIEQCGAGSQNTDYDVHIEFLKDLLDISEKKLKEERDEYDECD